jgi:hypothetical protein
MITERVPLHIPALDRVNRRTYRRRGVLRQFATAGDWLEPGERVAIKLVAEAIRYSISVLVAGEQRLSCFQLVQTIMG